MKGWRTIIFNVANGLVLLMDQAQSDPDWIIPDEYMPWWLALYTVGNIVLRLVTTTPVGRADGN